MTNTNQTLGDALKSPDPSDRVRWWRAAGGSSHPTAGRLGSALADDVERLSAVGRRLADFIRHEVETAPGEARERKSALLDEARKAGLLD